jgi:MFS family permease
VLGAVALASVARRVRRGRLLASAAYAFCVSLIAFSLSRTLWLSAALLLAVGFTMIINNALANGILQTLAPDELRGRVMAAYAFVFVGMGPIGSLLSGALASALGAPWAVAIGATVMLLFALWVFETRPEVRVL